MVAIIAAVIKIAGILLIVALLIIPAATRPGASPRAGGCRRCGVGSHRDPGGLDASATRDTPFGPSILVTALAPFIATRADGLGT